MVIINHGDGGGGGGGRLNDRMEDGKNYNKYRRWSIIKNSKIKGEEDLTRGH